MSSLPDAERDACDVLQALAGLVALLRRAADDLPGPDPREPALDDPRGVMLDLAEDGGVAAARVVAYLRDLRGAGDGEACAVSPRLGEWRDWVPARGHLFGTTGGLPRANEVPQPRRSDPGE